VFLSKISASGNDFLITHIFSESDLSEVAKNLCDRHFGVGADGFIALLPSKNADIKWLFYNSDGSSASMCGNGTRAAALYAYSNSLAKNILTLETGAGIIELEVDGNMVTSAFSRCEIIKPHIVEESMEWMLIDTGVPHLVTIQDELETLTKQTLKKLRDRYNANVNIGKISPKGFSVRTFERGVEDETMACGTGMAAIFAMGLENSVCKESCIITPKSGEELQFFKKEGKIFFKGYVRNIFDTIVAHQKKE